METKICIRCGGEPKPIAEFRERKGKRKGWFSYCINCQRLYGREHYAGNKQYYFDKAKRNDAKYLQRIREWLLAYFKEHPCIGCGETDLVVLEFDHRDGEEKEAEIGKLLSSHNFSKLKREILKCDVRCANCHKRRTAKQFGTWRWGFCPSGPNG